MRDCSVLCDNIFVLPCHFLEIKVLCASGFSNPHIIFEQSEPTIFCKKYNLLVTCQLVLVSIKFLCNDCHCFILLFDHIYSHIPNNKHNFNTKH